MAFYNPFTAKILTRPTIVYPDDGLEKVFDRRERWGIERHLKRLAKLNSGEIPLDTEYQIAVCWVDKADRMTDLWMYRGSETWGSGPLSRIRVFRNFDRDTTLDECSGNVHVVLGAEEEHRVAKRSLKAYLEGERPKLPARLLLGQDFYIA